MNFNEFVNAVVFHFTKILGDEYTVTVTEVLKNNNICLNGILMKKQDQKLTPNIYLNSFYERFIEGEDMGEILEYIWDTYEQAMESIHTEQFVFDMELEAQKDQIVYRIVNYKKNKKKLDDLPYIRFLDLAITFHCYIVYEQETVSMLPVTNELMEYWNINIKTLLQLAHKNTPIHFPMVYSSLDDLIKMAVDSKDSDAIFVPQDCTINMHVISNQQGVNGASVLLYEEQFQELVEQLGGSVYILPSSIHEIILVPYEEEIDTEQLTALVKEVNETQVPYEDILSDHAYFYSAKSRSFEIF